MRELADRLVPVLERAGSAFEIVFIDDGSRDQTSAMVRALAEHDPRIKLIRFTRNYGQEAAVQAGILRALGGRWIIQMDGDLQNPPEELAKLLDKRDEGYEIVYGVRTRRKDPLHRVVASRIMMWCHDERARHRAPRRRDDLPRHRRQDRAPHRRAAREEEIFQRARRVDRRALDERRRSGTPRACTGSPSTSSASSSTTPSI